MQEGWSLGMPIVDAASAGVRDLISMVQRNESQYFDEQKFSEVTLRRQLNDSSIELKLDAMKRILAASTCGRDMSRLFPDVVKNTSQSDLELKKLVYMFLVSHADGNRDIALLAVNSFQKDLSDRSQVVRGAALRAMTSIRVLEIIQILMSALRKAVADSSPYVRRIAAQSVPKILSIDADQFCVLRDTLIRLMNDFECCVVGAAVMSFSQVCVSHPPKSPSNVSPQTVLKSNMALLHIQFRRLCEFAPHMEAWPQMMLIDLLLRYAHFFFVEPSIFFKEYYSSPNTHTINPTPPIPSSQSPIVEACAFDYFLLLDTLATLLRSQTLTVAMTASAAIVDLLPPPAVVLSYTNQTATKPTSQQHSASAYQLRPGALRTFSEAGTSSAPLTTTAYLPLQYTQRGSDSSSQTPITTSQDLSSTVTGGLPTVNLYHYFLKVHCTIMRCLSIASDNMLETTFKMAAPLLFKMLDITRPYIQFLVIQQRDSIIVKAQKLDLLVNLCNAANAQFVLRELRSYLFWACEPDFTILVFRALAALALKIPSIADGCLRGLIGLLDSSSPLLAAESVVAVRTLLQQRTKTSIADKQLSHLEGPTSHVANFGYSADILHQIDTTKSSSMGPIVTHLVRYLTGHPKQQHLSPIAEAEREQQSPTTTVSVDSPGSGSESCTASSGARKRTSSSRFKGSTFIPTSSARASVVWIVGRYHSCPDVKFYVLLDAFRVLVESFEREPDEVKLQILSFGLKLWAYHFFNKSCTGGSDDRNGSPTVDSAAVEAERYGKSSQELTEDSEVATSGDKKQVSNTTASHCVKRVDMGGSYDEWRSSDGKPTPKDSEAVFPRLDSILRHVLHRASGDKNFDIQDMSRFYVGIVNIVFGDSPSASLTGSDISSSHQERKLQMFCTEYLKKTSHFSDSEPCQADDNQPPVESKEMDSTDTSSQFTTTSPLNNNRWILYSLAHVMNEPLDGYVPFPPFPTSAGEIPLASVRQLGTAAGAKTSPSFLSAAASQSTRTSGFSYAAAPEETVPKRSTNIPKMEFNDDLDSFYSTVGGSDLWGPDNKGKRVSATGDGKRYNAREGTASERPKTDNMSSNRTGGPLGSEVLGEDDEE